MCNRAATSFRRRRSRLVRRVIWSPASPPTCTECRFQGQHTEAHRAPPVPSGIGVTRLTTALERRQGTDVGIRDEAALVGVALEHYAQRGSFRSFSMTR